MPLPAAHSRTRLHTRQFIYQCYLRDDGLWDIDAELRDVKDYSHALHGGTELPAHQPIHKMRIRLTIDESLTVRDIIAETIHAPFPDCMRTSEPMRAMIGVKIGAGWRKEIEQRLGGVKGCTHQRDLLFNAATAAYQSVAAYALHERLSNSLISPKPVARPHFLGKCMAWALDGETVKNYEPEFYVPATERNE